MLPLFSNLVRHGKDDAATNDPTTGEGQLPATWDDYVAALPPEQQQHVQTLYETHNQTLLNSVKAVRDERDTLAKDLREAAKKAGKGSEAEAKLLEQASALDEQTRRADFFEDAPSQECKNAKAAFAIAKAQNLFDPKTGLPQWKAIRETAPELFGVVAKAKGKAGAGAGTSSAPTGRTVNDFIRQAAGAKSTTLSE